MIITYFQATVIHQLAIEISSMPDEATANADDSTASANRYFEYTQGNASKFWEVSVDGTDLTTRWGRIGSKGQSKTKTLTSADKAKTEQEKLISQKSTKGYQEILQEQQLRNPYLESEQSNPSHQ